MAFISGPGFISDSALPGIRSLPSAAVLADGRFLIAWTDNSEAGIIPAGAPADGYYANGWQVKARLFAADGTALGAEFRIDNPGGLTPHNQWFPMVAARPDGTFLVAYETEWRSSPDDPLHIIGEVPELPPYSGVAGRIVTPQEGAAPAVSTQFFLYTKENARTLLDELAVDAEGNYVAAISHYHGTWNFTLDRYTTLAEQVGSIVEGQVDATMVDGTAQVLGAGSTIEKYVSLAPLSGGGHVLAWHQRDGTGFNNDVFAQVLDTPGGGTKISVAVGAGNQSGPEVAALGTGNFIVTWVDSPSATLRGRVFDPLGNPVTPVVNLLSPGASHDFEAISLIDGGFALTWVSGPAVVGTIYLAAFGYDGSPTMSPTAIAVGDHPQIAQQADGDLILVSRNEVMEYRIVSGVASNVAPQSITLLPAGAPLPESAGAGTLVGTLSAVDPDSPTPPSFEVVDNFGRYTVVGNTLYLAASILDFETSPIESLIVRATDSSGNTAEQVVTFAVADANDVPTDVAFMSTGSSTAFLFENPSNGDIVGSLKAVDQDPLDVNVLTLVNDGGGAFGLNALGQIVIRDRLMFDAEGELGAVSGAVTSTRNGIVTGPLYFSVYAQDVVSETVSGDARDNAIFGGVGDDTLRGRGGNDSLYGERRFTFVPGGADRLVGNEGDDLLFGGAGDDVQFGGVGNDILEGGEGVDVLLGEDGNDTFIFRFEAVPTGERIAGDDGTDTLFVSGSTDFWNARLLSIEQVYFDAAVDGTATFTQAQIAGIGTFVGNVLEPGVAAPRGGDGQHVLSVQMKSGGTLDLSGKIIFDIDEVQLIGTKSVDSLIGTAGADLLDGGAGADAMAGGGGNDTYMVDKAGDTIVEAAGAGIDTVRTIVSHTLAANVENLSLEGLRSLTGIGNDAANVITGSINNDTINGRLGSDTLSGDAGRDRFVFDTTLGAGNVDTILDFTVGSDLVVLDNDIFIGLAAGKLTSAAFRSGGAALDADDRILYNSATGALQFDADGTGAGSAVTFAMLSPGLALSQSSILIV